MTDYPQLPDDMFDDLIPDEDEEIEEPETRLFCGILPVPLMTDEEYWEHLDRTLPF